MCERGVEKCLGWCGKVCKVRKGEGRCGDRCREVFWDVEGGKER